MGVISNKREMYELYNRDALGNHLKSWEWCEFLNNAFSHGDTKFGLRDKRPGTPHFRKGMTAAEAIEYGTRLIARGLIRPDDINISEDTSLHDERRTLQGEVWRDPSRGLVLRYHSLFNGMTCKDEVRVDGAKEVGGMTAKSLLETFLDVESWDWLQAALYELYPDAVVEFTSFDYSIGNLKWNTLFWEVRNY